MLLSASYYFYMCWKLEYIFLILFSTIIDYYVAIKIANTDNKKKKKYWLWLSLSTNLGLLFFFKYFNFLGESVNQIFDQFNIFYNVPYFNILLPVGISFYTFQTLSYTLDVYYGKLKPEKHFGKFALFVSFFPQLVAGPIERATSLLPQFSKKIKFNIDNITSGLRLILWGMFKKVVVADRLAMVVNQVYNNPDSQNGLTYILATYFFAFQIYCDFSGYSDIAIGSARVLGFNLMTNFKTPYISKSIKEFWTRWHISLSTWFKDYLYIPLGGNRVVKWRWYYNLFVVFLVSGMWHGANWTFLIWGALHGFYLVFAEILKDKNILPTKESTSKISKIINTFITFHLVLFAWIFFRAKNLTDSIYVIKTISLKSFSAISEYLSGNIVFTGLGQYSIKYIFLLIILVFFLYISDYLKDNKIINNYYYKNSTFRLFTYFIILYSIIFLGYYGETQFIYFQF